MTEEAQRAVARDVRAALRPYLRGGQLAVPMEAHFAFAQAGAFAHLPTPTPELRRLVARQSIKRVTAPGLSTSYPQPVPLGRRAVTVWHTSGLGGTMRVFQAQIVSSGHSKKEGCG